jgi:putative hydrolase of the HAD superfamily
MVTVWVDNGSEQAGRGASDDFIDYRTPDLSRWLHNILGDARA